MPEWPANSHSEPAPATQRKGQTALNPSECCPVVNCPLSSPRKKREEANCLLGLHHLAAAAVGLLCQHTREGVKKEERQGSAFNTEAQGTLPSQPQQKHCSTTD